MDTHIQTQGWIYRTLVVLGLIVIASMTGVIILMIIGHSLPEILVALGFVVTGGLIRLLISPLNRELYE